MAALAFGERGRPLGSIAGDDLASSRSTPAAGAVAPAVAAPAARAFGENSQARCFIAGDGFEQIDAGRGRGRVRQLPREPREGLR